jgi:hypothetical protein
MPSGANNTSRAKSGSFWPEPRSISAPISATAPQE